jgi:NDP-sugar pyrophosphorylase family protein
MINVGGKPVLQRNIEWLRGHGVREFVVNVHHRPEAITGFLRDGSQFDVHVRYSFERELLGTAGAVVAAAPMLLPGPFLVVYADNLIMVDVARLLRLHEAAQAMVTLALFFRRDVSTSGAVTLDQTDRVVSFAEKTGRQIPGWVNAGLLSCDEKLVDFIPRTGTVDFGHDVFPSLIRSGQKIQGYRMGPHEALRWIDTREDLARTEAEIEALEGRAGAIVQSWTSEDQRS